ncbi:porin family protein [Vibrio mediterranei]|uniref:porin family protein n=1 Tax=Vibrio TaxID=662 RepID=UPI0017E1D3A4|nr:MULTISPECIES: porin family protein [Vibrio]NUW74588.1 porin family protein [Vibrio mediterranei]USE03083.1 porin family protein [Vibrio sp. SCSIO 43133]
MKKTVLALSLAIAAFSTAPLANEGFYVGASYSKMSYDAAFVSSNEVTNGYSVKGGYDFPLGSFFVLGTELEYKNLGSTKESFLSDYYTLSMTSYGINVIPKLYMGDRFYALAKLGFHKINSEVETNVSVNGSSVSDTASVYGLGLGYDITEHFAIQASYEIHNIAVYNTKSANLGVKFNF